MFKIKEHKVGSLYYGMTQELHEILGTDITLYDKGEKYTYMVLVYLIQTIKQLRKFCKKSISDTTVSILIYKISQLRLEAENSLPLDFEYGGLFFHNMAVFLHHLELRLNQYLLHVGLVAWIVCVDYYSDIWLNWHRSKPLWRPLCWNTQMLVFFKKPNLESVYKNYNLSMHMIEIHLARISEFISKNHEFLYFESYNEVENEHDNGLFSQHDFDNYNEREQYHQNRVKDDDQQCALYNSINNNRKVEITNNTMSRSRNI